VAKAKKIQKNHALVRHFHMNRDLKSYSQEGLKNDITTQISLLASEILHNFPIYSKMQQIIKHSIDSFAVA
jgi:hypothetical protein